MIRAVILDYNGTLIDDERVHFELFAERLQSCGVALSWERYERDYIGLDDRGCFEQALRDAGQEPLEAQVASMIETKALLYQEIAKDHVRFYDGAAELITRLATDYVLAICSGALRREILWGLNQLGVESQVACIVAAEEVARSKPDPEGYLLALERLRQHDARLADLEGTSCLVLEDTEAGVRAGTAARIPTIGITQTTTAEILREAGAVATIDRLEELTTAWIRQRWPASS